MHPVLVQVNVLLHISLVLQFDCYSQCDNSGLVLVVCRFVSSVSVSMCVFIECWCACLYMCVSVCVGVCVQQLIIECLNALSCLGVCKSANVFVIWTCMHGPCM